MWWCDVLSKVVEWFSKCYTGIFVLWSCKTFENINMTYTLRVYIRCINIIGQIWKVLFEYMLPSYILLIHSIQQLLFPVVYNMEILHKNSSILSVKLNLNVLRKAESCKMTHRLMFCFMLSLKCGFVFIYYLFSLKNYKNMIWWKTWHMLN